MLWSKSLRKIFAVIFIRGNVLCGSLEKSQNTQKLELAKIFVPHQPRPQGFSLKKPWGRGWYHTVSLRCCVLTSYNGSAVHPVNWNSPLTAERPCARRPITKKNWSSIPENLLLTSPYGLCE